MCDAVILPPPCALPGTAAVAAAVAGDVSASGMMNVVAALCVHACMRKETPPLGLAVMDGLRF